MMVRAGRKPQELEKVSYSRHNHPGFLLRHVLGLSALALLASGIFRGGHDSRAQVVPPPSVAGEITLSVAVIDKDGNPVTGLPRESFSVVDGKDPQEITAFKGEDAPASVAIIIDLSGSVGGLKGRRPENMLRLAVKGVSHLIESGNRANEYFVIGFNNDHHLLAQGSGEAATAALNKLDSLPRAGQSALFDACRFGLDRVTLGSHQKKALILLTDGEDTYSRHTLEDIRRLLKERGVVSYALNVGGGEIPSFGPAAAGAKGLDKLAEDSGGLTHHPRKDSEVQAAVGRMAADMGARYLITFKPLKAAGGRGCYSFRVKATSPNNAKPLTVRSRQSHCPGTIAPR